jgi:hypothetical protein
MIRHAVMFKFKDDVSQDERDTFVGMLHKLAEDISEIRRLEVGQNFTESTRACDLLLLVDVESKEALLTYAQHPDHQPVIKRAGEICAASYVVDYNM